MKEIFGWTGKILRINLSNHSADELSSMTYASRFIGGRGLASRMYWDDLNPQASAFDPDNHLYFMTGPLCGTQASCCIAVDCAWKITYGRARTVCLGQPRRKLWRCAEMGRT